MYIIYFLGKIKGFKEDIIDTSNKIHNTKVCKKIYIIGGRLKNGKHELQL